MKKSKLKTLTTATDARLRYSQWYLDAIKNPEIAGKDEEKAHQESFVFHLNGVLDALKAEVNELFELGIKAKHLDTKALKSAKYPSKKAAKEVVKLLKLDGKNGWMEEARAFQADKAAKSKKKDKAKEDTEAAVLVEVTHHSNEDSLLAKFEEWQATMRTLIADLRAAATDASENTSKKKKK